VKRLHQRIVAHFEESMGEQEFLVPYDQQRLVATLHERTRVLDSFTPARPSVGGS